MKLETRVLTLFVLLAASSLTIGAEPPQTDRNLKLLPKDISRDQLGEVMKGFTEALGVRCEFCHVGEGDDLSLYDFRSDEKKHKLSARTMLRMVMSINRDFLPEVANDEDHTPEVTCNTCHRGKKMPEE